MEYVHHNKTNSPYTAMCALFVSRPAPELVFENGGRGNELKWNLHKGVEHDGMIAERYTHWTTTIYWIKIIIGFQSYPVNFSCDRGSTTEPSFHRWHLQGT